jgi:hypothetical protein
MGTSIGAGESRIGFDACVTSIGDGACTRTVVFDRAVVVEKSAAGHLETSAGGRWETSASGATSRAETQAGREGKEASGSDVTVDETKW